MFLILVLILVITLCDLLVSLARFLAERKRAALPPIPKLKGIDADALLNDLHMISRNAAGRVQIHDIERTIREHNRR